MPISIRTQKNYIDLDKKLDYIPVVSTATNLFQLFLKATLYFTSQHTIDKNPYYMHITRKPISRCIVLLIPVIGNVIIGIYDFVNKKKKKTLFEKVKSHIQSAKDNATPYVAVAKDKVNEYLNTLKDELKST